MNVVGKATIKFSKGTARNKRIFAWEEIYIDEEINLVNGLCLVFIFSKCSNGNHMIFIEKK